MKPKNLYRELLRSIAMVNKSKMMKAKSLMKKM